MRRPWYRGYLPGWIVTGAGGGSGAATVQSDNVTIQGDGSSGNKLAIKAVQTDTTLTGAGTVASHLGVNPLTGFHQFDNVATGNLGPLTANQVYVFAVELQAPWTVSNIWAFPTATDGSHLIDIGFYSLAGARLAHIGAQAIASTGMQAFAISGGAVTLQPGTFLAAWTNNNALLTFAGLGADYVPYANANYAASASGVLPASITAFAGPYSPAQQGFWLAIS